MQRYARQAVPIYDAPEDELVSKFVPFSMAYGYSIYRGIVVIWDEDYDDRVLTVIDNSCMDLRDALAVSEHEGSLGLLWLAKKEMPHLKAVEVAGDYWSVVEERSVYAQDWLPVLMRLLAQVP